MGIRGAHKPVLLREAVEALGVVPGGFYIDGTFGRGGHASEILARLGPEGRLLAIDRDPEAVAFGRMAMASDTRFAIEQGSFSAIAEIAGRYRWLGRVDGILLDLGVSSPQLDEGRRGFSFMEDGPLDMRMDPGQGLTAADWISRASQEEIIRVLRTFGEERFASRIARAIVEARQHAPISSTRQLADLIGRAVPTREPGKHPATRSFQAIRIHINKELEALGDFLADALSVLAVGGRLAVISFHSLEDRIVKRFMRDQARGDNFPPGVPVTADRLAPHLQVIGKAVRPGTEETAANPRARSAVLRVAEKLA